MRRTVPVEKLVELLWDNGCCDHHAALAGPHRLAGRGVDGCPPARGPTAGGADVETVLAAVRPIVQAVAERGAEAPWSSVCRSTACGQRRFGARRGARRRAGRAGPRRARRAAGDDPATRAVHADQRRTEVTTTLGPGATVTERWVPVERVACTCRGNAVYPSSVIMNVCRRRRPVSTPCGGQPAAGGFTGPVQGLPHPTILAAARLLGVDEVWAVGGAQAVALLAYGGTDTDGAELAPVDMITGPGKHLRHRRQTAVSLPGGYRRRSRSHRDRHPGDTPPARRTWPRT